MELMVERMFSPWRKKLWSMLKGKKVLEVGVGTGKNFDYTPAGIDLIGIDLTPGMLDIARNKASKRGLDVDLRLADVQQLPFRDDTFDTVIASFVFCSVPDPVQGMKEVKRVLKPGGQVLLLEHMRPDSKILASFFDLINPLVVRIMGANINRKTLENMQDAGLNISTEENLAMYGMFRLIEARSGPQTPYPVFPISPFLKLLRWSSHSPGMK
jgi:phosphatidylethanolamine/phosphatidyl-N-methylethanolamine N-methyltransferase